MLPQNATNVIIESERRIKPKEPDELLEVLKDQCFYRVSVQFFLMHGHAVHFQSCTCVPGKQCLKN
jgi:hypothetical protein